MFNQILSLVAAQFNNSRVVELKNILTQEEWNSKQLSKENMIALGLRGSPKLSKSLIQLGLAQQLVSLILSINTNSSNKTRVVEDEDSCLQQGNSIHYSSCQATDDRAAWRGGNSHNKVEEDLLYIGKTLFLWVAGEPMSVNGEGFKARAKLRVVYSDSTCSGVVGLYIDRMYGQKGLLESNYHELEEWWKERGETSSLLRLGGKIEGFVPSYLGGYQDSLSGANGYFTNRRNSLLYKAYRSRIKIGGVYIHSLSDVNYNPQKDYPFTPPTYEPKEWRGFIPHFLRPVINHYYSYIGKPETPINYRRKWREDSITIKNTLNCKECKLTFKDNIYEFSVEDKLIYTKREGELMVQGNEQYGYLSADRLPYTYYLEDKELRVAFDLPQAGFLKPVEFPYRRHNKRTELIVHTNYLENGWAKSEEFPYQRARGRLRVIKDIPEYGWLRPEPLPE